MTDKKLELEAELPDTPPHDFIVEVPLFISIALEVVLKIINPFGGRSIESLFDADILGSNNPLLEEVKSNTDDLSGVVVPIPICAVIIPEKNRIKTNKI